MAEKVSPGICVTAVLCLGDHPLLTESLAVGCWLVSCSFFGLARRARPRGSASWCSHREGSWETPARAVFVELLCPRTVHRPAVAPVKSVRGLPGEGLVGAIGSAKQFVCVHFSATARRILPCGGDSSTLAPSASKPSPSPEARGSKEVA